MQTTIETEIQRRNIELAFDYARRDQTLAYLDGDLEAMMKALRMQERLADLQQAKS